MTSDDFYRAFDKVEAAVLTEEHQDVGLLLGLCDRLSKLVCDNCISVCEQLFDNVPTQKNRSIFVLDTIKAARMLARATYVSAPEVVLDRLRQLEKAYLEMIESKSIVLPELFGKERRSASTALDLLSGRARQRLYQHMRDLNAEISAVADKLEVCYVDRDSANTLASHERDIAIRALGRKALAQNDKKIARLHLREMILETYKHALAEKIQIFEAERNVVRNVFVDADELESLGGCFCGSEIYQGETLEACRACGKQIHADCLRVLIYSTLNRKCPYCRERITSRSKGKPIRYSPY